MSFNEANTVEDYIKDLLVSHGWDYKAKLPRTENDVLVEEHVKKALIKLNPSINEKPERADEIIYKLRAIIIAARGTGIVKTNEEFSKWLRNEKTMPYGDNNEHVTIKLIDYDKIDNNDFIITKQYSFIQGKEKRIADLVLLVNGIPLVIGECKTPVRPAISWVDGALQLDSYQEVIPQLFVPNVFNFATEGKEYRAGSIKLPIDKWQPWRKTTDTEFEKMQELKNAVDLMLRPETVLDICLNFTLFSTDDKGRNIKVLARYQQYEATKQLLWRVIDGRIRKGLIWHFQGSGKSLLMIFAALLLRKEPKLRSPTVIVVVDRIDLNAQISGEFNATSVPNTIVAETRQELERLLKQDTRKVIITTIHKFGEAEGTLNERDNIIVLVDEAHRTQEGDLGIKMRNSLPNAFLFGLTGTPINKRDRNTFWAFGAEEDKNGYMNRYSFEQSLEDKATLPIYFEPRPVELKINKKAIDEAIEEITDQLTDNEKAQLSKKAAKLGTLIKSKDRIKNVCINIVQHYREHIQPNNFKGQVVVFDREACDAYKKEIDRLMNPEESAVVMTVNLKETEWRKKYFLTDDQQTKIIERFKDPTDPLKLLIVTSKLLTGFDAPINQVMYLDKPMKDHTLLQAICRVNRPYKNKSYGLIVDYLGVFDNVSKSLNFDLKSIEKVIANLNKLKEEIPGAMEKCLKHFKGIDKNISGYEGLLQAQDCLPTNEQRDKFAADYSYLNKHWESVSPNKFLTKYEKDYRWLTQVYQSLQPPSGIGKLVWHTLGTKTLDLINKNVKVEVIHEDLDILIMDENIAKKVTEKDAKTKSKEIEIKIIWRIHKHPNDPRFIEIGKKLEELKEAYHKKMFNSVEYLKKLLDYAKETVMLERETKAERVDGSKEALTQLFLEFKVETAPKIVEKIVEEIDSIVRVTRFDGWQWTSTGEREIQKALRKVLLKYKLHREQELFDKAYDYIREHY